MKVVFGINTHLYFSNSSLVAQLVKNACSAGDPGPIPGSGRSNEEGNGNPLQDPFYESKVKVT